MSLWEAWKHLVFLCPTSSGVGIRSRNSATLLKCALTHTNTHLVSGRGSWTCRWCFCIEGSPKPAGPPLSSPLSWEQPLSPPSLVFYHLKRANTIFTGPFFTSLTNTAGILIMSAQQKQVVDYHPRVMWFRDEVKVPRPLICATEQGQWSPWTLLPTETRAGGVSTVTPELHERRCVGLGDKHYSPVLPSPGGKMGTNILTERPSVTLQVQ